MEILEGDFKNVVLYTESPTYLYSLCVYVCIMNKKLIIGMCILLVLLSGCMMPGKGDFRCDNISPSSIINKMKIKTWDDCHDWLSQYFNMNISKTYC